MGDDLGVTCGVLLGFGSVGIRHARALQPMVDKLAIVDPSATAQERARSQISQALVASSLRELPDEWPWADTVATIATWGPSHAELFFQLAELGVRRIVCEKPIAHSLELADRMIACADSKSVTLAVNQIGRYMRRSAGVEALAAQFELGVPVSFVVFSGAACLVTSGVHFIDLATQLFHESPARVISTAKAQRINPRSPELGFYGGTAVWIFAGRGEATFSMSNSSTVSPSLHVVYRNGVIDLLDEANMRVRTREPEAVARYSAVTRLSPASRVVFQGAAPGVLLSDQAFQVLYREAMSGKLTSCQPRDGLRAAEACIGAIAAGESMQSLELPIPAGTDIWKRTWPIS